MMPAKVITKQDAIRAAYFICCVATGNGGKAKRPLAGDADISMSDEQTGFAKWRITEFEIDHPRFNVSASRSKHSDGRIRDVKESADNLISFASYVLTYLADMPEIAQYVEKWKAGMNDWPMVRRTMSAEEREFLPEIEASATLEQRMKTILSARVLAKLSGN